MRIYTRAGDKGNTQLLSGERVGKDHLRVKTYGALDELQSHLGLARALSESSAVAKEIAAVQGRLFTLSAELASSELSTASVRNRIDQNDIQRTEKVIDDYTGRYGLPRGFVIPGRSADSAALHVARAVCRRCERLAVTLAGQTEIRHVVLSYLNRLADLFFILAWALEVRSVIAQAVRDTLAASREGTKI